MARYIAIHINPLSPDEPPAFGVYDTVADRWVEEPDGSGVPVQWDGALQAQAGARRIARHGWTSQRGTIYSPDFDLFPIFAPTGVDT